MLGVHEAINGSSAFLAGDCMGNIRTTSTIRTSVAQSTRRTGLTDLINTAVVCVLGKLIDPFDEQQDLRLTQT